MTQLRIQLIQIESFLAFRSATAFLLSKVANGAIPISMLFWPTWLYKTSFSALLRRKSRPRCNQILEKDLWFILAARAR